MQIIWTITGKAIQCKRCETWLAAGSRAWHGNCETCAVMIVESRPSALRLDNGIRPR